MDRIVDLATAPLPSGAQLVLSPNFELFHHNLVISGRLRGPISGAVRPDLQFVLAVNDPGLEPDSSGVAPNDGFNHSFSLHFHDGSFHVHENDFPGGDLTEVPPTGVWGVVDDTWVVLVIPIVGSDRFTEGTLSVVDGSNVLDSAPGWHSRFDELPRWFLEFLEMLDVDGNLLIDFFQTELVAGEEGTGESPVEKPAPQPPTGEPAPQAQPEEPPAPTPAQEPAAPQPAAQPPQPDGQGLPLGWLMLAALLVLLASGGVVLAQSRSPAPAKAPAGPSDSGPATPVTEPESGGAAEPDAAAPADQPSGGPGGAKPVTSIPMVLDKDGLSVAEQAAAGHLESIFERNRGKGDLATVAEDLYAYDQWYKAHFEEPWLQWTAADTSERVEDKTEDQESLVGEKKDYQAFMQARLFACYEFDHFAAYIASDQPVKQKSGGNPDDEPFAPNILLDEYMVLWGFDDAVLAGMTLYRDYDSGQQLDYREIPRGSVMVGVGRVDKDGKDENNDAGYLHTGIYVGDGLIINLSVDGFQKQTIEECFSPKDYVRIFFGPYLWGNFNPAPASLTFPQAVGLGEYGRGIASDLSDRPDIKVDDKPDWARVPYTTTWTVPFEDKPRTRDVTTFFGRRRQREPRDCRQLIEECRRLTAVAEEAAERSERAQKAAATARQRCKHAEQRVRDLQRRLGELEEDPDVPQWYTRMAERQKDLRDAESDQSRWCHEANKAEADAAAAEAAAEQARAAAAKACAAAADCEESGG